MSGFISTAEAARRLGVAVSTVKRWADAGALPCTKTVGGHRRFAVTAVEAFGGRDMGPVAANSDASVGELAAWLRHDRSMHAIAGKLMGLRDEHGAWVPVADFVGAALHELGRAWARGELSVVQEHVISVGLARALGWLHAAYAAAPDAPHCMLCTPEGEDHTLGLGLAELCLVEAGWRTTMLGPSVPAQLVAEHLGRTRIDCVALSASSNYGNQAALWQFYGQVQRGAEPVKTSLVLGGYAPWPDAPPYGHRVRTFAELGDLLRPPSPLVLA